MNKTKSRDRKMIVVLPYTHAMAIDYVIYKNSLPTATQQLTIRSVATDAILHWCTYCPECGNEHFEGTCPCKATERM